ncbi:tRNA-specific adenosine deaminase [Microbacterium suaedae]|uniref:nucleoside deaminase n=1 Tax=Microbacterium suaedae TaxID=2067813 RepID=UPI000DAEF05C|nr:nucleoside deaminase [Microbacterium suaedae]
MHFPPLATAVTLDLPDWLNDELADVPDEIPAVADRVALVNRLADRNWREGGGGPFAALVAERATGRIVSVGVNVVLASNISLGHAEVTAIGTAQARLGTWDLGGAGLPEHELVVNWRPCVQCYGAAMWSGITSLVLAGHGSECEDLTTFDEGPMIDTWVEAFEQRGISVTLDVAKPEAVRVFEAYRDAVAAGGAVVYNARQA